MTRLARILATVARPVIEHLARYVDAAMVSDYDLSPEDLADYHAAACEMAEHMAEIRRALAPFDFADWTQEMAS